MKLTYAFKGPNAVLLKKIKQSGANKVCIYGAGKIGQLLIDDLDQFEGIKIVSVIDRKADFIEDYIGSIKLSPPSLLQELSEDIPVVVASVAFLEEITQIVKSLNNERPVISIK